MGRRERRGSDGKSAPLQRRVAQVVAALGAVVGLLVGVTTLVDWLGETLGDPPKPAPTRIDHRIDAVKLSAGRELLGSYLESTGQSLRGLSASERRELGYVFLVHVRLRGGVGERFPLRWAVYEAKPPQRLRGALYNQIGVTFVPRVGDHAREWRLWVPSPPRPGAYFLRATLIDQRRRPVDEQDSPTFAVDDVPEPR